MVTFLRKCIVHELDIELIAARSCGSIPSLTEQMLFLPFHTIIVICLATVMGANTYNGAKYIL